MTQDEIIRMALEAGLSMVLDDEGEKVVERFAALVAAHVIDKTIPVVVAEKKSAVLAEREACAKVCEQDEFQIYETAERCAAAIRARGEK